MIPTKEYTFRSYVVSYSNFDHEGKTHYYLSWCAKSNKGYRYRGKHCQRVTDRNHLAMWLKHIREDINKRWRIKKDRLNKKREAKKAFVNPYHVGQILHTSWGYDQTNIEYYQVTGVGKCSIKIRPISASYKENGFMSGMEKAVKNSFCGPETTQIIQVATWGTFVSDPRGHGLYEVSEKQLQDGIQSSCYA